MAKIPALLIMSVLLIGAFFQTGVATDPSQPLSDCAKQCEVECLSQLGQAADTTRCAIACEDSCDQIKGSGSGEGGGVIMGKGH